MMLNIIFEGCLISISSDKYIVKSDLSKLDNYNEIGKSEWMNDWNKIINKEKIHQYPLTAMAVDKENKRFFVTDSFGTLFIYSTEVKKI